VRGEERWFGVVVRRVKQELKMINPGRMLAKCAGSGFMRFLAILVKTISSLVLHSFQHLIHCEHLNAVLVDLSPRYSIQRSASSSPPNAASPL